MNDLIKFKSYEDVEKELTLVEKGGAGSWGNLFLLLDSIEQTRYFSLEGDSFTRWVERNAWRMHTKPAMIWRILSAGRFVRQNAERFEEGGVAIPSLENIPDAVSPENVELLAKLDRVTSEDTFAEFARSVFSGKARRAELRGAWETYRPVLEGKTARGRGVAPPRLDLHDPEQYRSVIKAATLDTFHSAGPAWTNVKSPSIYKVFVHVNPEDYRERTNSYLFAAVAVVKPKNGHIQYHGILHLVYGRPPSSYEGKLAYCDHLWVLKHSDPKVAEGGIGYSTVPDGIGVLEVKGGIVSAVKPAGVLEGAGAKRIYLASALLIRSLATK